MKQLIPRKYDRTRFLVDVEITGHTGGNMFIGHAIDLAQAGISVFANRFVQTGQRIELKFRSGRNSYPAGESKICGTVVFVRVETDGNLLGISFATPLSVAEMDSMKRALGVTSRS